ncbi:MAG: TetR/AcrR family transcriptional regulator [Anaerolineae bacterium]
MPRPRFEKLPLEKRERILEIAAKEFATHGYDSASFNQILEKAEVSKGAAYYYFDDKADLFIAVLDRFTPRWMVEELVDFRNLSAENFWEVVLEGYRSIYLQTSAQPWAFGVLRASAQLYRAHPDHPVLSAKTNAIWNWSRLLLNHGQQLGVVRSDLPEELLLGLIFAVDDTADEWFLQHWQSLSSAELERMVAQTIDLVRRLLLPGI